MNGDQVRAVVGVLRSIPQGVPATWRHLWVLTPAEIAQLARPKDRFTMRGLLR